MTTGTGLDTQFGFAAESVVGTPVTVTKFAEIDSESLAFDPGFIEPTGLRVGVKYKRGSRLVQGRKSVSGQVQQQFATRGMGLLVKQMLGSSAVATQIGATTAYEQVHQVGDHMGKSLTLQVGRPEPSGTVRPHTFAGCKVTDWEFSCSDNDTARLALTFDGWDEATATALATASYVDSEIFGFHQATLKLGGTASTNSGKVSIAGGATVAAVIRGITLSGSVPLDVERYGLGNGGVKREQLENATPTITGTLDVEYSQSEIYTPFKAGTMMPLQLTFVGSEIASGEYDTLDFVIPQIRIKTATPQVSGPDIVQANVQFEVYADGTNNPFQARIISADTAL